MAKDEPVPGRRTGTARHSGSRWLPLHAPGDERRHSVGKTQRKEATAESHQSRTLSNAETERALDARNDAETTREQAGISARDEMKEV